MNDHELLCAVSLRGGVASQCDIVLSENVSLPVVMKAFMNYLDPLQELVCHRFVFLCFHKV